MSRTKKPMDPVKHFAYTRWHKINARTVNGNNPDHKSSGTRGYLNKGRLIKFTRTEFDAWCEDNRQIILSIIEGGDIPSIDRIDDSGHYELSNMRIILLHENTLLGVLKRNGNRSKQLKKLHAKKFCLVCGKLMRRKKRPGGQLEKYTEFNARQTCDIYCQVKRRLRNDKGDFIKGVATKENFHGG